MPTSAGGQCSRARVGQPLRRVAGNIPGYTLRCSHAVFSEAGSARRRSKKARRPRQSRRPTHQSSVCESSAHPLKTSPVPHTENADARLFVNRDGGRLASIKKGFAAACSRASIEDLRPHDLRGTFATRLLDRGVPVAIISALLGHKVRDGESRVTLGYAQATWQMMVWAVESLERAPLFQGNPQSESGKKSRKTGHKRRGKTGGEGELSAATARHKNGRRVRI